ncbi:hypothetical protein CAI21_17245 [Alkalilimnicola ehrlichii]|uniref:Uncharacterized protein n=1 Tax=Alkalilimnicola ehrlichii TaxID=351052 RepID=A0A3E0WLX6_9GAMM|nr:hypothetical protein [Alkalilimnicola ehrlichii]RFA26227.1 hypothetical protein CAI21_17245 [Alkalilimnicola ehrlichii]RFA33213.1 hypothetical protein CAL65_17735 [Alkalilimnicola ehrlichii]
MVLDKVKLAYEGGQLVVHFIDGKLELTLEKIGDQELEVARNVLRRAKNSKNPVADRRSACTLIELAMKRFETAGNNEMARFFGSLSNQVSYYQKAVQTACLLAFTWNELGEYEHALEFRKKAYLLFQDLTYATLMEAAGDQMHFDKVTSRLCKEERALDKVLSKLTCQDCGHTDPMHTRKCQCGITECVCHAMGRVYRERMGSERSCVPRFVLESR